MAKTSTFIIDHDVCDPSKWTPFDVLSLGTFIKTGELSWQTRLAGLGITLVASENLTPLGGTLQQVGWTGPKGPIGDDVYDDLADVTDGDGVFEVVPVYRVPSQWCVPISIGDDDGFVDSYVHELFPTKAEADKYAADMRAPETPGPDIQIDINDPVAVAKYEAELDAATKVDVP